MKFSNNIHSLNFRGKRDINTTLPAEVKGRLKGISEDALQGQVIRWFRSQYPKMYWRLYSIPNAAKRSASVAARMKRTGMISGVADMFLGVVKNGYGGLYIELKVGYNKLTDNQATFKRENESHYEFKECRSLEDFIKVINEYLKL
ncbi:MAG: nuclease [Chitinophagaceae bacterium]|nr:nuclease [Chitinophagaceae bacterium]